MTKNNLNKNFGFSVLEAMIAMAIMLMTISASIFVSFGNQNFLIGEKTNSEALDKAQELLEYAQASARKDFKTVNPISLATDGIYKKWLTVEQSLTGDYFTKLVTSHVSWTNDSNITRKAEISSLVTDFESAVGGDTCDSFLTGDWLNPRTTNTDFANIAGDPSGIYPITDIDAYQKKLYVTINTPKITLEPNDPATGVDDNTVGTIIWNNPDRIKTGDISNATATLNGVAVTHYLKADNFGFSIPRGATILGIKVTIFRNASDKTSTNAVIDSQVRLIKSNGALGSSNEASGVKWPTSPQSVSYGNESYLWGETDWNPESVNNPNFGVAFAVTGNSASANRTAYVDNIKVDVTYIKEFYILDVSNPMNPTLITGLGDNEDIATGFNAIATDGRYAYVATNSGSKQFQIINVSSPTPVVASSFKVSGTESVGKSIFYRNGYVYLGLEKTMNGREFNIIDVHNPSSPQFIGSFPIGRTVNAIYVKGNYVFVAHPASASNNEQITVLDISDPANPFRVSGFYDYEGTVINGGGGKSLFVVGDVLYLGRTTTKISGSTDSLPELYALDKTDLAKTPSILGSLPLSASGDSINKIFIRDYLAFLLTNSQIQIRKINQTNPWTFSQYATSVTLPNSGAGVAFDCEGNYIYSASIPTSGILLDKSSISITTAL